MGANTKVDYIKNGVRSRMYEEFPYLNMQFSRPVEFVHVPDWFYEWNILRSKKRISLQ